MDNVVLNDEGEVRAILDWELCTLGDPLADLGLLMDYWTDAGDAMSVLGHSPTTAPGFSTRMQVMEHYGTVSDLDLSQIGYYCAFGYWKLACILQGVQRPLRRRCRSGRSRQRRRVPRTGRPPRRHGLRGPGGHPMSPDGLTEIFSVHEEPDLNRPVLVVALEGWVDAGLGARRRPSPPFSAKVRPRPWSRSTANTSSTSGQRRPVAHIVNGVTTDLTWPHTVVRHGHDEVGADVLYLVGPEPDFHWRAFTDAVVGLSRSWRVRMVVGLGAFPAPAPHTRPVKLAATAPPASADLVERIGIVQGELEVPAGVMSALELAFADIGIPPAALWARVPHYVAGMPFPEASAALVEGLADVGRPSTGLLGVLRHAADSSRRQVDQLIADNIEHRAMVRKLEENIDASEGNAMGVEEVRFPGMRSRRNSRSSCGAKSSR